MTSLYLYDASVKYVHFHFKSAAEYKAGQEDGEYRVSVEVSRFERDCRGRYVMLEQAGK